MLEVKQVPMEEDAERRVVVQLKNEDGSNLGNPFDLPISISIEQLQQLANQLLNLVSIFLLIFKYKKLSSLGRYCSVCVLHR